MIAASDSVIRVVLVAYKNVLSTEVLLALLRQRISVVIEPEGHFLERRVMRHSPDVVLLWHKPAQSLPQLQLEQLRKHWPLLLLAKACCSKSVLQAMRAGASGYLLIESVAAELLLAVRSVLQGNRYLSSQLCTVVLDMFIAPAEESQVALTRRQKEVLFWLTQGESIKEIAFRMNLSNKTVNAHKAHIQQRLGINNLAGLVFYALRQGIIDFPADPSSLPRALCYSDERPLVYGAAGG